MDHVAYPDDRDLEPLIVPYVCDALPLGLCDIDGFRDFPKRAGWVSESGPSGVEDDWLACSCADRACRAQGWLYFGLLSCFLEISVETLIEMMVSTTNDTQVVCSKALMELLRKRQHIFTTNTRRSTKPGKNKQAFYESDNKSCLLRVACRYSAQLESKLATLVPLSREQGTPTADMDRLLTISCSIRIVLQTLGCAKFEDSFFKLRRVETHHSTARLPGSSNRRWRIPNAQAVRIRMLNAGWCPSQIRMFSQAYSCSAMYFFSGLRRQETVTHAGCCETECIAYNIDNSTYKQAHDELGCNGNCCTKEVNTTELSEKLSAGQLPIIVVSEKPDGDMDLELEDFTSHGGFVAVSHVWSGGLGNPVRNGLHVCQLKRVVRLIREYLQERPAWLKGRTSRIAFWLDTLCIPSGGGEAAKTAKAIAISRMSLIFSEATAVMILDKEIQKINIGDTTFPQTLAHILCSSWMMRCWTLREASMAENAYVQFRDKRMPLRLPKRSTSANRTFSYFLRSGEDLKTQQADALLAELGQSLILLEDVSWTRPGRERMWHWRKLEIHQAFAFAATWNNFLGRSTTKLKDFYRNFGAMQDFSASSINELMPRRQSNATDDDEDTRAILEDQKNAMKAMLKGHATLPLSLLYLNTTQEGCSDGGSFVPTFPPADRLDASLGYLKVFSDYLVIKRSHKPATMDQLPPGFFQGLALHERFSIWWHCTLGPLTKMTTDIPLVDSLCFEYRAPASTFAHGVRVPSSSGSRYHYFHIDGQVKDPTTGPRNLPSDLTPNVQDDRYVIVCPDVRQWYDYAEWYHFRGALFKVTDSNGSYAKLWYLRSVHVSFEDDIGEDSIPPVERLRDGMVYTANLVPEETRLLVHCGKQFSLKA